MTDQEIHNVVATLSSQVTEFSQATKNIKTLTQVVKALSGEVKELKRQRQESQDVTES